MNNDISFEIDDKFRRVRQALMHMPIAEGISHSEFGLMNVINDNMTPDGITVSRIASIMDITPPAVSRTLRSLDEKGYIERRINVLNRRSTIVTITESGMKILSSAQDNMLGMMSFISERMGNEQVTEFNRLFGDVLDYMAEFIKHKEEIADDKNT